MSEHYVTVTFGSRDSEGGDIASTIRKHMPDADLTAEIGEDGSVQGYHLTLHYANADTAATAALRLGEFLTSEGFEYEVDFA